MALELCDATLRQTLGVATEMDSGLAAGGYGEPFKTSFGRADLTFAGFTPRVMARLLAEVELAAAQHPPVRVFNDVVALHPLQCLYHRDGSAVNETRHTYLEPGVRHTATLATKMAAIESEHAPARIPRPEPLRRVREPVFFIGKPVAHYGHAILDTMARLWALNRLRPDMKVVYLPLGTSNIQYSVVRQLLNGLGIGEDRLHHDRLPTVFDELICPLPAIQWSARAYPVLDRPHRRLAQRIGDGDADLRRPIYLSRRGLGAGHRRIDGEDVLEQRLEREGYLVVRPETLSLADQIEIFNSDAPVIGPIGSAMHTLLFRRRQSPKPLAMMTDRAVGSRFLLVDAVKGSRTTYVACFDPPEGGWGATPVQERTLHLDSDRAMQAFDDAGLIGARPRPRRWLAWRPDRLSTPRPLVVTGPLGPTQLVVALKADNPRVTDFDAILPGVQVDVGDDVHGLWNAIVETNAGGSLGGRVIRCVRPPAKKAPAA